MKTKRYNDFWVILGGSLFFSYVVDAMNREETIYQRLTQSYFYIDLAGGFAISTVLWVFLRYVTIYLDRHFHWYRQSWQRFLLQFLLGLCLPALLSFLLTFAYMKWSYNQDIFQTSWIYSEFYLVLLILGLINLLYFTWWLYLEQKQTAPVQYQVDTAGGVHLANSYQEASQHQTLEVSKAGKKILLPAREIAYAYLSNGFSYIKTRQEETYLTNYSLEEISAILPKNEFARINRQIIVSKMACTAYQSVENGKISLELTPAFKEAVIVSQKRAKAFRQWISTGPKD